MKRAIGVILVLGASLLLSGCSLGGVKSTVDNWMNTLITKDQQKQQGFVVTSDMVYNAFDDSIGYIDMADMNLSEIPNFCILLEQEDYVRVISINLMNNNITLAHQDLSCLTRLRTLNLSYNDIETVSDLGDLPNLKELYLHKNEIASTQGFPTFPALERLNLSYNNLKELSSEIGNLDSLLTLELGHNQLEKLVGVERLEKLERLKVEFNKLKEIDSISDLKNLELVTAKGNELKESVISTLEDINRDYIEANLGSGAGNIGAAIIREVESSIDNVLE